MEHRDSHTGWLTVCLGILGTLLLAGTAHANPARSIGLEVRGSKPPGEGESSRMGEQTGDRSVGRR